MGREIVENVRCDVCGKRIEGDYMVVDVEGGGPDLLVYGLLAPDSSHQPMRQSATREADSAVSEGRLMRHRYVGQSSQDGWIRKWFFRSAIARGQVDQMPRFRVLRGVPFEVDLGASGMSLMASVEGDDGKQYPIELKEQL